MTRTTVVLPEYNGHANYPTWNVLLWLDNEEWSYNMVVRFAKANRAASPTTYKNRVKRMVKEYINDGKYSDASCYADIKGWAKEYGKRTAWAIARIDWDGIVEAIKEHDEEGGE